MPVLVTDYHGGNLPPVRAKFGHEGGVYHPNIVESCPTKGRLQVPPLIPSAYRYELVPPLPRPATPAPNASAPPLKNMFQDIVQFQNLFPSGWPATTITDAPLAVYEP